MPSATRWAALFGAVAAASIALWPLPQLGSREAPYAPGLPGVVDNAALAMKDVGPPAPELTVYRRMMLALEARIPSLGEIRAFEAERRDDRLDRALEEILASRRFAEVFAERWSKTLAGTEGLPEIVFRGDRLRAYLTEAIDRGDSYAEIVSALLTAEGLWTGSPATNFMTGGVRDNAIAKNVLTARLSRAFLGQRLDCAECHDHPFARWTRADFAGLAGFFAETQVSMAGIEERPGTSTVAKRVPFGETWLEPERSRRAELAGWVVNRLNRRFHRAAVNRVFAILFGRPWRMPTDDLPDPEEERDGLLDPLAQDFASNDTDLRRLIRALVRLPAFRAESRSEGFFPLTPLRPEQLAGALRQIGHLEPPDPAPHALAKLIAVTEELRFLSGWGTRPDDAAVEPPPTVTQTLFSMNGELPQQLLKAGLIEAAGRVSALARSDRIVADDLLLMVLTRHATEEEKEAVAATLAGTAGKERERRIEDLLWALSHTAEATWNH